MPSAHVYGTEADDLEHVCRLLRAGEIVALPTETVYGLAADALNETAVRGIFSLKGRPLIDPLIVHVADHGMLESLATFNPTARKLADRFWPGPLTLVLPKHARVPDLVTAGRPTVAIRMPAHPVFARILRQSGLALAAPSANPFGYVSPTRAAHVSESLGDRVAHIVDGGSCSIGLESTIVDCTDEERPCILRPGPVTGEDLTPVLGSPPPLWKRPTPDADIGLPAPGMLSRHYSPRTPLLLVANGNPLPSAIPATEAVVHFQKPGSREAGAANRFWLSEGGDPAEAARNLFHLLRTLDAMRWTRVYIETAPGGGMGDTLNDRLQRAAAR